jgi:hypothetical protein
VTRAAAEKIGWAVGIIALVAVLTVAPATRPVDAGLWMASLAYLLGLHWIVAYVSGGTMYGAMRLQPTQRLARTVIFAAGLFLVVVALQYLLGFGGPFA